MYLSGNLAQFRSFFFSTIVCFYFIDQPLDFNRFACHFQDPTSRVLVCTHSNSAADLYIREYLHPYIEKDNPGIKLLRIYYKNRWVQTVHATVQKYCLISLLETSRVFRYPTVEDVSDCQIVVATLSTSR